MMLTPQRAADVVPDSKDELGDSDRSTLSPGQCAPDIKIHAAVSRNYNFVARSRGAIRISRVTEGPTASE
jgi:hypothetical protein